MDIARVLGLVLAWISVITVLFLFQSWVIMVAFNLLAQHVLHFAIINFTQAMIISACLGVFASFFKVFK